MSYRADRIKLTVLLVVGSIAFVAALFVFHPLVEVFNNLSALDLISSYAVSPQIQNKND